MSSCLVDVVVRLYPHFTRQRSEAFQTPAQTMKNDMERRYVGRKQFRVAVIGLTFEFIEP